MTQFVCDFMEDHSGVMYLLQVKSFECEGLKYEWQMPSPVKKTMFVEEESEEQKWEEMERKECRAGILCNGPMREWFVEACKECEMWEVPHKKGHLPMVSERLVKKYHKEIEYGREACFIL